MNRLHLCHEEFKEKKFELEMSWVCEASNNQHQMVPKDLKVYSCVILYVDIFKQEDAEKKALQSIEEDEMAE